MRPTVFAITTILALLAPGLAGAQARDSTKARDHVAQQADAPACCRIVRVDSDRQIVTARETATGFTFSFAVRSKRLIEPLKIGQPVWADFAKKTVKLRATDIAPCCGIVDPQEEL